MTDARRSYRWRGALAVALLAVGVGVLERAPAVLLSAVVAVAVAAYPHATRPPVADVSVDHEFDDPSPDQGDDVTVTVTVRNDGDRTVHDLRVVDGVPAMLAVSDGTPRHATSLAPGAATTFSYAVEARHGEHQFRPPAVVVRDRSGGTVAERSVATDATLACRSPVDDAVLRRVVGRRSGRTAGDVPGSGVEFDRVREYRRTDPLRRVDWNRVARTGEVTTVTFREERSRSVVACLDARPAAYRAVGADGVHAVFDGAFAATELLRALARSNDAVGVAVLGDELRWVPPSADAHAAHRARSLLAEYAEEPPDGVADASFEPQVRSLAARLDATTQVVLVSPLTDRFPFEAARRFESARASVTVVSPDPTAATTRQGVVRDNQLYRLRRAGVPVVDWTPTEPLSRAVAAGGPRR